MEITHFHSLPVGAMFTIDGEGFRKTSEVAYRGVDGLERYIDPITDAKLGKAMGVPTTVPEKPATIKLQGTVRDGNLVVSLRGGSPELFEGAAVTVDGHFDSGILVVTGIAGSR